MDLFLDRLQKGLGMALAFCQVSFILCAFEQCGDELFLVGA